QLVSRMPKLSPREAVKVYQVSRATLTKALRNGDISADKTDAGHWQIDPSELARLYHPRPTGNPVDRTTPDYVSRDEPDQKAAVDQDVTARLARAEAELAAEREKVQMLQRHLDDVRRMLPAPDAKPRRRWWPF
uniref:hypothetical protein n=1 Tax=Roseovarius sp. TaxID=1486281 RepID=UPI0035640AE5